MIVYYVTIGPREWWHVRDASGAIVAGHASKKQAEEDAYRRNFGTEPPTEHPHFFDVEIGMTGEAS